MKRYHNKKETKKIGSRIQDLRKKSEFSIEDIAAMTGFTRATISAAENGSDIGIVHLIEIAKAIGVHPMEIFNVSFELKPRYKLPPNRRDKSLLTSKISKLFEETDFFKSPRFVNDVMKFLIEEYKIKPISTHVSVVLKRLVEEGKLQYKKVGRKNYYIKRK